MNSKSGIVVAGALALVVVAGLTREVVHAQDAAAAPQPAKIAVADMIGIVDKLMSQGSFKAARDQFDAGQLAAQEKIKAEFTAIQADSAARTEAAKTDDEKAKITEETDAKVKELQTRYQGMQGETDTFTTGMLADAYKLATETATTVAHLHGYTMVLASRTSDVPRDRGSQLAFQEILLRHVAVAPAGDDLTKAIEKELKLVDLPPAGPVGPAAPSTEVPAEPAPAPAPAPAANPK